MCYQRGNRRTLNRCELCLGTNHLSKYNNGKGEEKRLQEFLSWGCIVLSNKVGVVKTSLGFSIWLASLHFLWVMRLYIVWVKSIIVTLKIPTVSAFCKSSRELAKPQDELRNTLTLQLPHVLLTWPFAGAESRANSWDHVSLTIFTKLILNPLQLNSTKYKEIN